MQVVWNPTIQGAKVKHFQSNEAVVQRVRGVALVLECSHDRVSKGVALSLGWSSNTVSYRLGMEPCCAVREINFLVHRLEQRMVCCIDQMHSPFNRLV